MPVKVRIPLVGVLIACLTISVAWADAEHKLNVTAVAYTLDEGQTDDDEDIGAWGDELDDEEKIIAVSRDLLSMGLTRGTKVRIDGRRGEYVVMDLMHTRWTKRIDILMESRRDAFRWGKRKVTIRWAGPAIEAAAEIHEKPAPKILAP